MGNGCPSSARSGRLPDGRRRTPTDLELPIAGLQIGQAEDADVRTGVTVVLPERPAVASVHVVGGSPGTRETDLLNPVQQVQCVDAVVLAGGSAFGLDAAAGVQAWLRERQRGFPVGDARIPIVPAAILYDLNNGGDKNWKRYPPYRELGYRAASTASQRARTGKAGAGYGATTATTPGGLGITWQHLSGGATVLAIMAVNAAGSPLIGSSDHYWAAPFERDGEYGGRGLPDPWPADACELFTKTGHSTAGMNTTIGVVVTDAVLTKVEAKQIAIMAHDGFARALYPVHTPGDGDLLFVLSTGGQAVDRTQLSLLALGTAAANTVTRAIAQGVHAARLQTSEDAARLAPSEDAARHSGPSA